jgi:hypothetical protein
VWTGAACGRNLTISMPDFLEARLYPGESVAANDTSG